MHSYKLVVAGACAAFMVAATAYAQSPAPKLAEERFKNIQALKGTPADQVFPAMQFIAASLGVECEFCHVEGKFEADDKRPKQTARKMIAMTLAINKDSFNGHLEVTCYTCHRGAEEPTSIPPVLTTDAEPEHHGDDEHPASASLPKADEILAKYLAAVGGADAMHKVTSRVASGAITAGGHDSPIELFTKAPDKRISITKTPNGESITAFDGVNGWLGGGNHPAREMSGGEAAAAKLDADFYFAAHLKEIFTGFRVRDSEDIDGHKTYLVNAMREGQPPVRLYFDQTTGLLVRQIRYAVTPIGRNPTQIDYADYRALDGVKIPYRWTLSRPNGRFTIQLKEAKDNVAIEDAKFQKPAGK